MSSTADSTPRPYRMRKRLEDVDGTRRRIVEAAVDLHGSVGPSYTTFSGVAARAGVQRSTVYRHFPDEEALFGACTSHWLARHPWPRVDEWRVESDPVRRLERGLRDLYRYYDENEQMLANAYRDIEVMPTFVGELLYAQFESTFAVLDEAWPTPAEGQRAAAIRLALDLRTWQSLKSNGLRSTEAAGLVASMLGCLGG